MAAKYFLFIFLLCLQLLPAWQQQPAQQPGYYYYPPQWQGSGRPGSTLWDPFVYGQCVGSFIHEESCSGQIMSSFWTGRVYLSPGCCDSVRQVSDECVPTAFGVLLANPFFGYALKGYCATRPWIHSLHGK